MSSSQEGRGRLGRLLLRVQAHIRTGAYIYQRPSILTRVSMRSQRKRRVVLGKYPSCALAD